MTSDRIPVEPAVLLWARQSLGLDANTAAGRVGVSARTLASWEAGDVRPTIKQLRNAARVYKRPLGVLLLSEPPTDFDPVKDFRAGPADSATLSPELQAEVRRALGQREVFLELMDLDPGAVPDPVSLPRIDTDSAPEAAGQLLREWVAVTLESQFAAKGTYEALNLWMHPIQDRGILVVNVSGIDTSEVAGFSVTEWPYPVIAVNGSDWPRRRLFTLLHELVHLALNTGGVCDLHEAKRRQSRRDELEHFCNTVAAAALLPREALLHEVGNSSSAVGLDALGALGSRFSVSSESVLLRLISLQAASWNTYWELKPQLEEQYRKARERERESRKDQPAPLFYQTKARNLGHSYVRSVLDAYESEAISSRDVADYLDIKFNQIPKLERVIGRQ